MRLGHRNDRWDCTWSNCNTMHEKLYQRAETVESGWIDNIHSHKMGVFGPEGKLTENGGRGINTCIWYHLYVNTMGPWLSRTVYSVFWKRWLLLDKKTTEKNNWKMEWRVDRKFCIPCALESFYCRFYYVPVIRSNGLKRYIWKENTVWAKHIIH